MKKKIIIIIFICTAVIALAFGVTMLMKDSDLKDTGKKQEKIRPDYIDVLEDGTVVNKSEALNKDRTFDGLKIDNINFSFEENGMTSLEFVVSNEMVDKYPGKTVVISIIDKNQKLLQTLICDIPEIEAGTEELVVVSMDADIVDGYDLQIRELSGS